MNDVLADTQAIVWYLFDPPRLSPKALQALQDTEKAGGRIRIATITLVEVCYLVEKGKLVPGVEAGLWGTLADPNEPLDALPLTEDVVRAVARIPRSLVPDMPDRIIAATALAHGLRLVTSDAR